MTREGVKKILKAAAAIYFMSFLVINWSDVSWMFNYRMVSTLVRDFFNPYPSIGALTTEKYFYPNRSDREAQNIEIKNAKITYTEKNNILEIPKLSISTPIIFPANSDKDALAEDLNYGVVYYPGSVYPGQAGEIVILGHSAPIGWPKVNYDWVFSDLDKLFAGDSILINLNNKQYTYIVKQKSIIAKGSDARRANTEIKNNILILISCWPPGKDYQRITVEAELLTIKNDFN